LEANAHSFRSETLNDRLKRTLERNRTKPLKREPVSLKSKADEDFEEETLEAPKARQMEREEQQELKFRKAEKKAPASISYVKKNRTSPKEGTLVRYMIYAGWAFCFILLLRLIFAGGGILDNLSRRENLDAKISEYNAVEKENETLGKEIELIMKNKAYQKKLVRDHLGFIASEEFLVLFREAKTPKSI
jgi:cell division protein FtsB